MRRVIINLITLAVAVFGGVYVAANVHAQNEKFVGDTTPTPLVIDLDAANGVDIVWHGVRGHLRPDQIAKFAHRLSLTCEPECHE